MRRKGRYNRHLYNAYDLDLKKSVVIYAEENGNKEAQARYGISEANIRRWRRLKEDIFGKSHDYDRGKLRMRKRVNYACKLEKGTNYDHLEQDSQGSVGESTSRNSMPLQERLSKVAAQEKIAAGAAGQVLKSQPLSPTKLKVTRQGAKMKPVEPPQSPVNEEMCLRWNSHHSNMQTAFPNILSKEQYVDVTLAAEGKTLKCHRLILSSCSPYFEEILSGISPFQHPVLFMRDIPFWILKSLCDFMYAGEVHIYQNKLEELLTVAEALKIKGLAGKSTPPENQEERQHKNENSSNKEKKRQPEKEKPHHPPPPPLKRNPMYPQSNNFESTSHDYDDDLLDPLDLLEPLYEEAAEEKKPSTIVKPKENKVQYQNQPMKRPFTRRLRKRKYSEQREPSPPPVFSFRKGTRSRPNVKIPKYYHSDYSNKPPKITPNSQTDPLLDVDEIKTEPIDVEDNLIDYSDEDHYMENSLEPANCDSPIIITSAKPSLPQDKFKKIKLTKPIITEVHTIEETNTTAGGLEVIKITVQQPGDNKKEEMGDPLQGVIITEPQIEIISEEGAVQNEVSEESQIGSEVTQEGEEAPENVSEKVPQIEVEQTENADIEVTENALEQETGAEVASEEVPMPEIRIADVRSECLEEEEEKTVEKIEEEEKPVEEKIQNEEKRVEERIENEEKPEEEKIENEEKPEKEKIENEEKTEQDKIANEEKPEQDKIENEEKPEQDKIENEEKPEEERIENEEKLEEEKIENEEEPKEEPTTSLQRLEKEAMSVVEAINMENKAAPPDIE